MRQQVSKTANSKLMFDSLNDTGTSGDAPTGTPTAPIESADASAGTVPAIEQPVDTTVSVDSGATAPTDPSQLTTPAEAPLDQPAELTDEQQEAELLAAAADPTTPKWARDKIQQAMGYAGKLKEAKTHAESLAEQFRSQYEGKATVDPTEIERMRSNEERLLAFQSITATPEQIEQQLAELNPRVFEDFRRQTVWNAVSNPDGSPNLDNVQSIVDRFAGEPGKVAAQDVLLAIEALKTGTIAKDDLHSFSSPEAYEAYQQQQARERELNERISAANENLRHQETEVRKTQVQQAAQSVMSTVEQRIQPLVEKFKLTPQPNEPKVATDYKARVNDRIAQLVNQSVNTIPALGEVRKAFDILGKAGDKPVDANTAVQQIQQFFNGTGYQTTVNKGVSELIQQVERVVAEEAAIYNLLMEGYAARNARAGTARPIVGSPNQSAGLPQLTPDQLQKLSNAERNRVVSQTTAEMMNQVMSGQDVDVSRFAG